MFITKTSGKSTEHRKVQLAEKKRILKRNVVWIDNSRRTGVRAPWEQSRRKVQLKNRNALYARGGERIKVFGGEQSVKLIIKETNFCLPTGDTAVFSEYLQVKIQLLGSQQCTEVLISP